jgi:hypothetical protein
LRRLPSYPARSIGRTIRLKNSATRASASGLSGRGSLTRSHLEGCRTILGASMVSGLVARGGRLRWWYVTITADKWGRPAPLASLFRERRPVCRGAMGPQWWLFHQDEATPQQVPQQPLSRDPAHYVVRIMDPPPAVIAKRKGQGLGDFLGSGWPEVGCVWHGRDGSASAWNTARTYILAR